MLTGGVGRLLKSDRLLLHGLRRALGPDDFPDHQASVLGPVAVGNLQNATV